MQSQEKASNEELVYIEVEDCSGSQKPRTHVQISIYKSDSLRMAVANITPVTREGTIESFRLGEGRYVNMEPMPRLKRGRLKELAIEVAHQIRERKGKVWDAIKVVLIECRLTIKETAA